MFDNLRADIREARKVNVTQGWADQHIKVFTQPGTIAVINYRYRRWARCARARSFSTPTSARRGSSPRRGHDPGE